MPSELLWSPNRGCRHDLPTHASNHKRCVYRCCKCNGIFESRINHFFIIGEWKWKKRSEKWLHRKLKKEWCAQ